MYNNPGPTAEELEEMRRQEEETKLKRETDEKQERERREAEESSLRKQRQEEWVGVMVPRLYFLSIITHVDN